MTGNHKNIFNFPNAPLMAAIQKFQTKYLDAYGFYSPTEAQLRKARFDKYRASSRPLQEIPEKMLEDFRQLEINGLLSLKDESINFDSMKFLAAYLKIIYDKNESDVTYGFEKYGFDNVVEKHTRVNGEKISKSYLQKLRNEMSGNNKYCEKILAALPHLKKNR